MLAARWMRGSGSRRGGEPRSVALAGERTVVGRDPGAGVHIDDEAVSWNHLEIERRGEVLMATDLDSRNGTALNGEPLDRPRRLRNGDTLIVGGHRLEVSTRCRDGPAATVAPAAAHGCADRRRAGDRGGPRRSVPQRGRLRRASRDPGRDRRGAECQRAHRAATPRCACGQARRLRRRRSRAPAPDRRPRDRARPRPPASFGRAPVRGPDRAKGGPVGDAGVVGACAPRAEHRLCKRNPPERGVRCSTVRSSSYSPSSPSLCCRSQAPPPPFGRRRLLACDRRRRNESENRQSGQLEKTEGGLYAAKEGRLNQLTEDPADSRT